MRLDKFLTTAGMFSRKNAGYAVRKGHITVNGTVCIQADAQIADDARVEAYGKEVQSGVDIVLAMHKPAGYLSATEDKRDKTVMDLLKAPFANMPLSIVGRLDKDTEGLLLLTTDGQFLHFITSPKNKIEKEYYLETDLPFAADDVQKLAAGVWIGEGETVCGTLTLLDKTAATLTVTEGKFHQIKRMIFALGKTVCYLKRVRIGGLTLSALNLEVGEMRVVSKDSILKQ